MKISPTIDQHSTNLISQLRELEAEISYNESMFNLASDTDLIDALIYEGQALQMRYRYFLKQARTQGISYPSEFPAASRRPSPKHISLVKG